MVLKYKNEMLWIIPWFATQNIIDNQCVIKNDIVLQMADNSEKAKEIASKVINNLSNFEGWTIQIGNPVLIDINIINKVVEEYAEFDEELNRE